MTNRRGRRPVSAFPSVSTTDQARAILLLLNRAGARHVHAIVGASYGGAVAQHLAALLGRRLGRLVLLSAAHKASQFALALRDIQRSILDLGDDSAAALALVRALAIVGYRSPEGFERRFAENDGAIAWLAHHGRTFAERFNTSSYRCLSASLDAHRIDPAAIAVPTTVFSVAEDLLVPPSLAREFAAACAGSCELVEIASHYGHDAFLKEEAVVARSYSSRRGETVVSRNIATQAVRAGVDADAAHGAIMPPLYLSTNYSFAGFAQKRRYDYTRSGNPTRDALAEALAELEGGAGALVTASGMAAITLLTAQLRPDDLILAPHDCYGGCYRLFKAQAERGLYRVEFVDFANDIALGDALARKPKIVWIETPSNPLLRITDIAHVAQRAHAADALVVVDNTFLSPAIQQPLQLGADVVVHSTTKYLNGHSDVVGGAVIWKDAALGEQLAWWCNCLGLSGAPFDSFLTLRGVRTLQPRLKEHQANALRDRGASARSFAGRKSILSRIAVASGPRTCATSATWIRRDAEFRADRRRGGGARFRRWIALFQPCRIARRRGKSGRASGDDDARQHGRRRARPRGHWRRIAAPFGRHRSGGRSAGRSRGRA